MKTLLRWTLPLFLIDQVTKALIVWRFPDPRSGTHDFITVIPGFFKLDRVHNTGMTRGFFGDWMHANTLFLVISIGVLGLLAWLWRRDASVKGETRSPLAVMIAGILGNGTDRLFRGHVIDFLTCDFGTLGVSSFNFADCCLTLAVGWLIAGSIRRNRGE